MAKKPGPKKRAGSPRRSKAAAGGTNAKARARAGGSRAKPAEPPASRAEREPRRRSVGSRVAGFLKGPTVRNVLAATFVSAAGALLWNRRESDGENERAGGEDRLPAPAPRQPARKRQGSRQRGAGASTAPSSDPIDPLVAAGVAGKGGQKRSAVAGRPGDEAPAAQPEPEEAAPSHDAAPGGYPDGSPVGDVAGRTSVESTGDQTT